MFQASRALPKAAKAAIYAEVYGMALVIPAISVAGVLLADLLKRREARRLRARGFDETALRDLLRARFEPVRPNWWILGGSLVFVAISLSVGLSQLPFGEEIVFLAPSP
jgi:hypothetical protein